MGVSISLNSENKEQLEDVEFSYSLTINGETNNDETNKLILNIFLYHGLRGITH